MRNGTYCPAYAGSNSKFAMTDATTAFISMIDIVFPIQACGPAMNENIENVELYNFGRSSQRAGLNLHIIIKVHPTTDR